jgi:hypothetical protein
MSKRTIVLITLLSALLAFSLYRWSAPPANLELWLSAEGEVRSEEGVLTTDQVATAMQELLEEDPYGSVILYASAKAEAGEVVLVVQTAEKMGTPIDVRLSK